MVNGAGLALATVDLLKEQGGEPADFMDVRPEATRPQITHGFKLLLRNPAVNAILVNIYGGGILRCATLAEGVAAARRDDGPRVPRHMRAAGTNGELPRKTSGSASCRERVCQYVWSAALAVALTTKAVHEHR